MVQDKQKRTVTVSCHFDLFPLLELLLPNPAIRTFQRVGSNDTVGAVQVSGIYACIIKSCIFRLGQIQAHYTKVRGTNFPDYPK